MSKYKIPYRDFKLPYKQIMERKNFAIDLILSCGDILNQNWNGQPYTLKPDHSPVTPIDILIKNLVWDTLPVTYPKDGLTTEEGGTKSGKNNFHWYVDEIDSSGSYARNIDIFPGIIFSLTYKNTPVMGVTYQPGLNDYKGELLYAVLGKGAFARQRGRHPKLSVSSAGLVNLVVGREFKKKTLDKIIKNLNSERCLESIIIASGALKMNMVSTGKCTAYISKHPLHPWDIIGPSLILTESGGMLHDFSGDSIDVVEGSENGLIAANNAFVSDYILKAL